jgi:hypothetical protein
MDPVVVAPTAEPPAFVMPATASASAVVALRRLLGNGISRSLEIAAGVLQALVSERSRLRC